MHVVCAAVSLMEHARNLMAPDSMKNLGYQDLDKTPATVDKPESSVNAGKGR